MMKSGEAHFFEHCDLPGCDLGTFEYVCPVCGKHIIDYEIWWKEDDIWKGNKFSFKCPDCDNDLIVEVDTENHEYKVKPISL
jgi:predicted RNA-binding Zn-ribbon protein involved in translation (DUF1610 family)